MRVRVPLLWVEAAMMVMMHAGRTGYAWVSVSVGACVMRRLVAAACVEREQSEKKESKTEHTDATRCVRVRLQDRGEYHRHASGLVCLLLLLLLLVRVCVCARVCRKTLCRFCPKGVVAPRWSSHEVVAATRCTCSHDCATGATQERNEQAETKETACGATLLRVDV